MTRAKQRCVQVVHDLASFKFSQVDLIKFGSLLLVLDLIMKKRLPSTNCLRARISLLMSLRRGKII